MEAPQPRVLKLTFAYDGSAFHGWQRQPGVRTVQGTIEEVARRVLREPLDVVGASRTDTGVHAVGQAAHLLLTGRIPTGKIQPALGHRLPEDIALVEGALAASDFHAIRDAIGKTYRYRLHAELRRPVALLQHRYAWHIWHPLDLDAMRDAAGRLCGTHDFTSLATSGSPRENNVRTITRLEVTRVGPEVQIEVEGNGFLYNMVRNLTGTLVDVGRGLRPPERIDEILAARDRRAAGPTAPPHGLCLLQVHYPPGRFTPCSSTDA
jgi:tRNA pseudouridine38-40 synthase